MTGLALFLSIGFLQSESAATLAGKKIGLDPGHGAGVNSGVVIAEGTWTLDAAFRARTHLQNDGAAVVMTRTTGADPSLSTRVNILNTNNVHRAVSLHSNAASAAANGIETYYCSQNPSPSTSQTLANQARLRALSMVHNNNRGTKECLDAGRGFHFTMVRNTNMPTTLPEYYFHTNSWENQNIHNTTTGRENVGKSLYAAICDNYGQTPTFGGPPPSSDEADNSALITDPSGNVWFAAVKADNDLYTRRYDESADTWNSFTSHGSGWSTSASPALVAQTDGTVRLIAVKSDGTMWSRKWTSSGGWSGFSQQGSGGWAVNAGPVAVRQTSGEITFAAVKQSGALYHRTYNPGTDTWGGFGSHSTAWSNDAAPCLIAGTDGKLWLFAVKADGRIYHRSWTSSGGWTGFYEDGAGSWSADAGPVGCAKANGDISWAAVKANGALYMRHLDGGSWSAFGAHSTAWSADASPSVAYGSDGKIWLFAVKQDGTTYHQSWDPTSGWTTWYQDGAYSDWSINVGPVVATRPNGAITWIGTKEDGVMYTRFLTGSWEAFVNQGSNWSK